MSDGLQRGRIGRRFALLAGPCLLASACITSEDKTNAMTEKTAPTVQGGVVVTGAPPLPAPPPAYRGAVGLGTIKGEPAPASALLPVITTEQLSEALRRSLSAAGVLAEGIAPRFTLDAELEPINRPFIGTTYEIRSVVQYRVVEVATGRQVLSLRVEETGVSQFREHSQAFVRIQLAEARSIRQGIARLLAALYGKPLT
jgi:hypothetical protein